MGTYLNPGNKGFQKILGSEYVDKTGLIALINKSVDTMGMLTCISRPRRFGKSYAAKMLCAYYDCSCDSHALFDDKEIARTEGYLTHLDALIREAKEDSMAQKRYLYLLREWFKNNSFTPQVVAAAYMTGILPIKKCVLNLRRL